MALWMQATVGKLQPSQAQRVKKAAEVEDLAQQAASIAYIRALKEEELAQEAVNRARARALEEEDLAQQAASVAYIQELLMHSDVITSTAEWHHVQVCCPSAEALACLCTCFEIACRVSKDSQKTLARPSIAA